MLAMIQAQSEAQLGRRGLWQTRHRDLTGGIQKNRRGEVVTAAWVTITMSYICSMRNTECTAMFVSQMWN